MILRVETMVEMVLENMGEFVDVCRGSKSIEIAVKCPSF